jgi:hypothetical protein
MVRRGVGRDHCGRSPHRAHERRASPHIDPERFIDAQQVRPQVSLEDGVTA